MKGWRNLSFRSVRGPTGLRDAYLAVKRSTKRSGLQVIHILKRVHLQQLKRMQTSKQADVKEAPFCQWKVGMQKGYPFCQKWWPPRVKRFLAPPPLPGVEPNFDNMTKI